MKQADLSRATSIMQPNLSAMERGLRTPTPAMLAKIARALGTTPAALQH